MLRTGTYFRTLPREHWLL